MFGRIKRIFSRKESAVGSLVSLFNLGRPVWSPRQYDKFAEEGYQKNVIAYASIREVAKSVSSVSWLLYRQRGSRRMEITDHPLLTLLKRPNPLQGGQAFFEALIGFFEIAGNAYIEQVGPDRRPPRELYVHRPDRIKVIPGRFGLPAGYEYSVSGQKKTWEVDPITGRGPMLHIKTFNPLNDWYGMSPIEAAAYSIDIHNESGAWNKALLDNSARPSGALMADQNLTDEQFTRLKTEIDEKYSSYRNAGKPILTEGGLKWQEMGLSPKDMDWINSRATSSRDIALAFGVPPFLLGIPGDNTYSNQKEARLAFWEQTVLPIMNFICDELNNAITPLFGADLSLDYDEDRISALSPRREKKWERVRGADFLTINEKREALGYEPVTGGDEVYIPAALLPLGFGIGDGGAKSLEMKLLNDTGARRSREWAIQMRQRAQFEKSLAAKMARLLDEQSKLAAAAFASDGLQGLDMALKDQPAGLESLLTAHYRVVMEASGKRVLDGLKGRTPLNPPLTRGEDRGVETKDAESFFANFITSWIARYTAKKVGKITETTRKHIIRAIEDGEAEGMSIEKIADRIREKTGGTVAQHRGRTIAITETHSAATAANDGAAGATGLKLKRSWLTARDENTRETHAAADGQVRGMDEPFDIGGYNLMRPGDPDGPPGEIIRCRCVVDYLTGE